MFVLDLAIAASCIKKLAHSNADFGLRNEELKTFWNTPAYACLLVGRVGREMRDTSLF